ncbi:hypothetical protein SBP28_003368 [Candidozyma auris]
MVCHIPPDKSSPNFTNPQSAFSPLNLVEDASSKKDLEEDHTREIEIENAFKTFQEAISLQRQRDFVQAYVKYKELQKKDVIYNHYYEETEFIKGLQNGGFNTRPDELSYVSQNVKTIRFLYFRNRGFLYFNILKRGRELIEQVLERDQALPDAQVITYSEFVNELVYSMIDDFINCFVYSEVDEPILRLLYDLFTYFGVKKLARYTLEYALSLRVESEDVMSVLPMNDWAKPLWKQFEERGLTEHSSTPELEEKLSFLAPIRQEFYNSISRTLQKRNLQVTIKPQSCWADVLQAFNSALRQTQDKEKQQDYQRYASLKVLDPYLASESMVDTVTYSFPVLEQDSTPLPEPVKEDKADGVMELEAPKPEDGEVMIVEEEKSKALSSSAISEADKIVVQRTSRRLNREENVVFELDDVQLTRHHYFETVAFFKHIDAALRTAFHVDDEILHDVVCHIVDTDLSSKSPLFVSDFVKLLNEWKPHVHTELLMSKKKSGVHNRESDADKLKLLDVLTHFGNQSSASSETTAELIDEVENYDYIKRTLAKDSHKHPKDARIGILYHLLGGVSPPVLSYLWGKSLYDSVKDWLLQLDCELKKKFESIAVMTEEEQRLTLSVCVSIFEIFVDAYISTKTEIDKILGTESKSGLSKAAKSALSHITTDLLSYKDRIKKLDEILQEYMSKDKNVECYGDAVLYARYIWANNYLLASQSFSWKEKKFVVVHLQRLSAVFTNHPTLSVSYSNYFNIGNLNPESFERRLTTSSILSIFSKILWSEKSTKGGAEDTIVLLENILIPKPEHANSASTENDGSLVSSVIHGRANLDKSSLSSVSEFLDVCPIDLKLSLWNILFSYYEETAAFDSFQRGFEQNLSFMLSFFKSAKYCEMKRDQDRAIVLLNTLNYFGGYIRIFLRYLARNNWTLPYIETQNSLETVKDLAQIFELFYCFSLHEEAALITGAKFSVESRSKKAFQRLKDFCIETITLILVYCINQIKNDTGNEEEITGLLLLVHNQLGIRRLCDSSSGVFLKLAEDTLVVLHDRPDVELSQLLSCRFHYKVKINDRFPSDHGTTKSAELDKASAKELANFILPLCFRNNPLLKVPRNDMKQVVDDIFDVLKQLDHDTDKILVQNNARIEMFYQNTVIDTRFIKRAFYGLHDLSFQKPHNDYSIANKGLYFVEAIFMFNSYKIRKKSAQSRTVELEMIIRLLKDDLISGSERVESWILLGQAYGYIVEDDLIWTSDKLNIIERKVLTANLQRQSLLSYIMAINLLTQKGLNDAEHYKPVISVLMNSFVKELYNANRSPLDMIAFKTQTNPKFVRKRHTTMLQPVADQPTLTNKFCFKLMQRCLHLAIRSNDEEWTSYYYLAKIQNKLGKPASQILDTISESSDISFIQGTTADPFLEASYSLCSWTYKFFKAGKITLTQALDYLKRDPFLKVKADINIDKAEDLYRLLIACFKTINSLDKKGWYHKQCYRMAVIYYDEFDDFKEAKKIMSRFFTLKATNKTYLQMWKPEHERPGKHFVYMYQYTEFYIKLLRRELDLASLVLMLPKLRRANSTMIKLYFAWENICSSICKLIRVIAKVEDGSTEKFLFLKPHQTFVRQAKHLNEAMKGKKIPEDLKAQFCYLYVINEMRKLNNGFGPTSLIDDTLCSVYLRVFSTQVERLQITDKDDSPKEGSKDSKVKRLARRDLFPFITGLVTVVKRDVEGILKDHSDIFNDFMKDYIRERQERYRAYKNSQAIPSRENIPTSSPLLPAPVIGDSKSSRTQVSENPAAMNSAITQSSAQSTDHKPVIHGATSEAENANGSQDDSSNSVQQDRQLHSDAIVKRERPEATLDASVQQEYHPSTISDSNAVSGNVLPLNQSTSNSQGAQYADKISAVSQFVGKNESNKEYLSPRPSVPFNSPGRTGPRAGIIKKGSVDAEIEKSFIAQTMNIDSNGSEKSHRQQEELEANVLESREPTPLAAGIDSKVKSASSQTAASSSGDDDNETKISDQKDVGTPNRVDLKRPNEDSDVEECKKPKIG